MNIIYIVKYLTRFFYPTHKKTVICDTVIRNILHF